MYDYENNLIGRKVFWKGQPCIINSYQRGCGTVTLIPDGIDHFEIPGEFKNDENYFFDSTIKNEVTDKIDYLKDYLK